MRLGIFYPWPRWPALFFLEARGGRAQPHAKSPHKLRTALALPCTSSSPPTGPHLPSSPCQMTSHMLSQQANTFLFANQMSRPTRSVARTYDCRGGGGQK